MPKRPTDMNQRAKKILDIAIGDIEENKKIKNAAAVELGRLGGLKGGKNRTKSISPSKRREIAKSASRKRWEIKP